MSAPGSGILDQLVEKGEIFEGRLMDGIDEQVEKVGCGCHEKGGWYTRQTACLGKPCPDRDESSDWAAPAPVS